jgi:hypothetical protein
MPQNVKFWGSVSQQTSDARLDDLQRELQDYIVMFAEAEVAAAGAEVVAAAGGGQPGLPNTLPDYIKSPVSDSQQVSVRGRADSMSHLEKDAFERGIPWSSSYTDDQPSIHDIRVH